MYQCDANTNRSSSCRCTSQSDSIAIHILKTRTVVQSLPIQDFSGAEQCDFSSVIAFSLGTYIADVAMLV